ncbi:MAG: isoprenylcysteine carboxylmethyltransferase family protein [Pirellulaceae bacterium]|nr:isoprenylcysteine carboxylmethyltransferase family protein [Planctomycetales bacterium]
MYWSILLIALQIGLAALLVLSTRFAWHGPQLLTDYFGMFFSAFGMLFAIWGWITMGIFRIRVMPQLRSNATLLTTGPYAWVRHPMYTGLLLFLLGLLVVDWRIWRIAAWGVLIAVLLAKLRIEERELAARFGERYASYRRNTGRLLPKRRGQ